MAEETKVATPEAPSKAEQLPVEDQAKIITPQAESEFYTPEVDNTPPRLYADEKKEAAASPVAPEPPKPKEEPEPAPVPEPEPATAKATAHSSADIAAAVQLGIPAAEIDEMTPKELTRAIGIASRIGQASWDAAMRTKPGEPAKAEAPKPAPAADEIQLDFGVDEAGNKIDPKEIHPAIITAMKSMAKAIDDKWAKRIEASEQVQQQNAAKQTADRVLAEVAKHGDGAAKALDRTTAAGQQNLQKFWARMDALSRVEQIPEPELVKQVLASMGVGIADKGAKQDAAVEAAMKEKQRAFDAGAIAKPESRTKNDSVYDIVAGMLKKKNLPVAAASENESEVDWLP